MASPQAYRLRVDAIQNGNSKSLKGAGVAFLGGVAHDQARGGRSAGVQIPHIHELQRIGVRQTRRKGNCLESAVKPLPRGGLAKVSTYYPARRRIGGVVESPVVYTSDEQVREKVLRGQGVLMTDVSPWLLLGKYAEVTSRP